MADWMLVQTPFGDAPGQVRHVARLLAEAR